MDNELLDCPPSFVPRDWDPTLTRPVIEWLCGFLAPNGGFVAIYRNSAVSNYETIRKALLNVVEYKLKNGQTLKITQAQVGEIVKKWKRWYGELEKGTPLTYHATRRDEHGRPRTVLMNIPEYQVNCFKNHVVPILDYLGFPWRKDEATWMMNYNALVAFEAEYRHTQVQRDYQTPDGVNLGRWVDNIRARARTVRRERRRLLEEINFEWSHSPGRTVQTQERMRPQHASGNTGRASGNTGAFARHLVRDMDRHIRVLIEFEKVFHHIKLPYPFLPNEEARDNELLNQTRSTYVWLRKVNKAKKEGKLPPEIEVSMCTPTTFLQSFSIYLTLSLLFTQYFSWLSRVCQSFNSGLLRSILQHGPALRIGSLMN